MEVAVAVRHLAMHPKIFAVGLLCAFATLAPAADASTAVVRGVRAAGSAAATRVVVDIDGEFRYRTHSSPDGGFVMVDIEGATLAPGASRMLPVSDARVDGVIVLEDPGARIVRISVDIAGRIAPRLETGVDGSRLVLTFVDSSSEPAGGRTTASTAGQSPRRSETAVTGRESPRHSETAVPGRESPRRSQTAVPGRETPRRSERLESVRESSPIRESVEPSRESPGAARPVPRRSVVERPVVVLDPGHGGKDPGARAWTGEFEKDIVLDLADRVARRLRKGGDIEVVMTRSGDAYVTLADRRDASRRWGADVFVSIHANASHSAAARGIETYYHSQSPGVSGAQITDREVRRLARAENGGKVMRDRSTAKGGVSRASLATDSAPVLSRRAESVRLARLVQTELVHQLGMRYEAVRDLGAKEGPFFVIGDNAAPSVLVEAAFLTHREEGLRMRSEVYREQIADGVARGILAFLELQRQDGAL